MSTRFASICLGILGCFLFAFLSPAASFGQKTGNGYPVGILISQEIRPFIQMVEGLEANLKIPEYRIFMDREGRPYSTDPRFKGVVPERFSAMVAVGPRALSYLIHHKWPGPLFYGMILNPSVLLEEDREACGVSLNLPYQGQFLAIHRTFPDIRRLGILFDPLNNQDWFDQAEGAAELLGIRLIPLFAREQSDISTFFEKKDLGVDAVMFIPDRSVISRAVIEYVIKEAIFRGVPAIGYNRFFHDSGALMSFIIDYRGVGKRVAQQVKNILEGRACAQLVPEYKILVNVRVAKKLGLRWGSTLPERLEKD